MTAVDVTAVDVTGVDVTVVDVTGVDVTGVDVTAVHCTVGLATAVSARPEVLEYICRRDGGEQTFIT